MKNVLAFRFSAASLLSLWLAAAAIGQTPSLDKTVFLTWHGDPTTTMVAQWLVSGALPPMMPGTSDEAAFDTPRLPRPIVIDGRGDDWGVHGLRLDYLPMADPAGAWPDPVGFTAIAKVGWTADGVAVLVHVRDDEATEAKHDDQLWTADGVEAFLGFALTDSRATQLIVSPGIDPAHPALRSQSYVHGDLPENANNPAAAVATDDGYTVELLMTWEALGVTPEVGETYTFQLLVNDQDGEFGRDQLGWYPAVDSSSNRNSMQTIRLTEDAKATVRLQALARFDDELGQIVLDLGGEPRLIGERVVVRSGEHQLATAILENVLGFAGAVIPLDVGDDGNVPRIDAVSIHLDDRVVGRSRLPLNPWRITPEPITVERVGEADGDIAELSSKVIPFGRSGWYVHRVSMAGLAPDSQHLLDIPGLDEPLLFRTAPATLDRPLIFAEGGDVGVSREVGMLHDHAASWDPLFGLVGGDCAYGDGVRPEMWLKYLQLWREHMMTPDGRSIPMLCTIGNHEVAGGYGKTKEEGPFFYALFGPLYPHQGAYRALDFSDYLSLILLDSGHTAKHGGRQAEWLDKTLAARADVTFRFPAYHVPAYPSHRAFEGHHSAEARENWVPLFEKHAVTAVFEHHDHTYKRTHRLINDQPHPDGVLYLGDGAWGRTPRTVDPSRPYLAVALSERNVIRVELTPAGDASYLAVDEFGVELDRYPEADITRAE
ncbi:MAG: sugar-binding protein [Planctomycetota bacterium]